MHEAPRGRPVFADPGPRRPRGPIGRCHASIAVNGSASLPGSRLLSRLVEPATELARHVPLFSSRLDRPSPDRSAAARAEFRERALFQFYSVSGQIQPKAEFDLFSREVSVRTQTTLSLLLEPTLQPLRHPLSHFPRLHSPNSPFGHPPVWPRQADFGSSISSLDMLLEPILCS